MSNLIKKALGAFVDFKEEEQSAAETTTAETAATDPGLTAPADLSQDPDVLRVQQAITLLSSLPLGDIPVDKVRELIVRTLKFAGLEVAALLESFQRVRGLYQERVAGAEQAIAAREEQHRQIMQKLEEAIAAENQQSAAEVAGYRAQVTQTAADLDKIQQAMAFFAPQQ